MNAAGLLLGAGFGRRFGGDKRRHEWRPGEAMIVGSARLYASAFAPLLVTLRPEDRDLRALLAAVPSAVPLQFVEVPDAAEGMGRSIAAGARALCQRRPVPDTLFIALADMPYIEPATLEVLKRAAARAGTGAIVRPRYGNQPGHPVGFGSRFLEELTTLQGDAGARTVLERHAALCELVDVDDPGVLQDVDVPPAQG
jgi:molybdenum cofactor cytidylyltransferase